MRMVTALARMLIKDYGDTKDPQVRKAYGMLCGAVGILLRMKYILDSEEFPIGLEKHLFRFVSAFVLMDSWEGPHRSCSFAVRVKNANAHNISK